jgi:hypothetical protein
VRPPIVIGLTKDVDRLVASAVILGVADEIVSINTSRCEVNSRDRAS